MTTQILDQYTGYLKKKFTFHKKNDVTKWFDGSETRSSDDYNDNPSDDNNMTLL